MTIIFAGESGAESIAAAAAASEASTVYKIRTGLRISIPPPAVTVLYFSIYTEHSRQFFPANEFRRMRIYN